MSAEELLDLLGLELARLYDEEGDAAGELAALDRAHRDRRERMLARMAAIEGRRSEVETTIDVVRHLCGDVALDEPRDEPDEATAYAAFRRLRWAATRGDPVCVRCGSPRSCELRTRRLFRCRDCRKQFSATSGTVFHSRKLSYRDCLRAIGLYGGRKKVNKLALGRELGVDYKTSLSLAARLSDSPHGFPPPAGTGSGGEGEPSP